MQTPRDRDERILILVPAEGEAALAEETLRTAGFRTQVCSAMAALCAEIAAGAGAALLAQEAFSSAGSEQLLQVLEAQPPWSDLPLVVLVGGTESSPASLNPATVLRNRANATFLTRPVSATVLADAVQVALRARRRQYVLRDHLQALAEAREAERRARAAAEEAVRIRDDFLASVAHDLKNPLGAIKGYAQLLRRQAARLDAPQAARLAEGLGRIDAMVSKAIAQVDALLDLARLQSDQPLQLELQATDLVALARRVAAEYQMTTTMHRLTVETDLPELYGVWDARRLERALGNLLANAIRYSPAGGDIVVRVGLDVAETTAILSVQDHGIGIPAADLPRIFERFYRASNTRGRYPGEGLGLAGVRQIVEQHGGSILVESVEGVGSTFTLRLPIAGPQLPKARSDAAVSASGRSSPTRQA